jgi:hypothetical protein
MWRTAIMSVTVRVFLVSLVLVALASPALAQFETASILGTVRDSTKAVVSGATVTVTNTQNGVSATKTTDSGGNYEFPTVRRGIYVVTAEKAGFAIAMTENVEVSLGSRQRVDLNLAVGQLSETVQVTGTAGRLETETSQRGQLITGKQAVELPLNGREYSALVLLTTGARLSALNTGSASTIREGSFNVNGLRSTANNFLLDGADNNAYGTSNQGFSNQVMQPPPDAVAEFKVVTNNMSAEYGRSGGATINVAYLSGTNKLHASAWEFVRNTSLNATGFFKPIDGKKPPMNRNQFGFVVGGPIMKNRAFFFGDYEGFRQIRKNVAFATIPDMLQRQGILSVPVRDPNTGIDYPAGTVIPMTAMAAKVLGALPAPTNGNAANNYQSLQRFQNYSDKGDIKIDLQFSPRLSAFARYGQRDADYYDQPNIPLPSGGAGNSYTYAYNKQFAAGVTWIPSDNQLWEFRFGMSRTRGGKNPAALGTASAFDTYGITGLPSDSRVAGGLPTTLISGYSDLGRQATNPQWQWPNVYNPKVNYTWTHGRHSVKTGLELQFIYTQVQDVNPLYGRDEYSGRFSRPVGSTSTSNLYNLSDFMFGLRNRFALSNILVADVRQNMYFGYVQDDIKVNSNLTLNLGVRYEYGTPQWEKNNILTNYDPAARQMLTAKNGSMYDKALINPDKNNWSPRLGFAYLVTPNTVVRGGYGINYIHFQRAGAGNMLMINGPQVINAVVSQTSPTSAAFVPTQAGYPAGITDPTKFDPLLANITYMPANFKTPSVQSWFISVQRELMRGLILDVAYVGNKGKDLLLFANYNQAIPNNAAGSLSMAARRPIQTWGDITYAFNGGKSEYRALQVRLEARGRWGLNLLNAFTWSRSLDNGSGSLEGPNGNFPAPQDLNNLAADYSYSGYDQPFNNTTSLVWELPIGKGRRFLSKLPAVAEAILGNWTVSGINNIWSGERINLVYAPAASFQVSGITQDFRGANNYRPNVVCNPVATSRPNPILNYFDTSCVVVPTDPTGVFGNSKRNGVQADPFYQLDMSLAKTFLLGWRQSKLQFRFEAFNVLNTTNFRAANSTRTASTFGSITATYDPRQLQLGIKFIF